MKKSSKGFSLIELLIVVAIILIIAAIAIPNLLRARVKARNTDVDVLDMSSGQTSSPDAAAIGAGFMLITAALFAVILRAQKKA